MTTPNNGGAAFPLPSERNAEGAICDARETGMTLRDYFAAKAPPPPKWWMDSYAKNLECLDAYADVLTQWAYCYADSMLRQRGAP